MLNPEAIMMKLEIDSVQFEPESGPGETGMSGFVNT